MLKKVLTIIPRDTLGKRNTELKPARFVLSGNISGKKALKKEFYTTLLEIILELNGSNKD